MPYLTPNENRPTPLAGLGQVRVQGITPLLERARRERGGLFERSLPRQWRGAPSPWEEAEKARPRQTRFQRTIDLARLSQGLPSERQLRNIALQKMGGKNEYDRVVNQFITRMKSEDEYAATAKAKASLTAGEIEAYRNQVAQSTGRVISEKEAADKLAAVKRSQFIRSQDQLYKDAASAVEGDLQATMGSVDQAMQEMAMARGGLRNRRQMTEEQAMAREQARWYVPPPREVTQQELEQRVNMWNPAMVAEFRRVKRREPTGEEIQQMRTLIAPQAFQSLSVGETVAFGIPSRAPAFPAPGRIPSRMTWAAMQWKPY
jgi:hypothetical protein